MSLKKIKNNKGFTIIELMVSVAIFALMTTLLLAKYGTFNQGILLTNLAYDMALTIRNAQSYGLNVKSAPTATETYSSDFDSPYGVHFEIANPKRFIFYVDRNGDHTYNSGEEISITTIKGGTYISSMCINDCSSYNSGYQVISFTFKRPDPNATIYALKTKGYAVANKDGSARITLTASDGEIKYIIVNSNGQISVE